MAKRLHKANSEEKKKEKEVPEQEHFALSEAKKKKIIGFILIILGIVCFLSIISFHPEADSSKLFSSYDTNPAAKASDTKNWLGVLGANVAFNLIDKGFGYFSIIFPMLLLLWGYGFFQEIELKRKLNISLFLVLIAVILSSFCGVLLYFFPSQYSWMQYLSGAVGKVISGNLQSFLGNVGAPIILLTALIVLFVFAFDFKVETIVEKGKTGGESLFIRIWHLIKRMFNKEENEAETGETAVPAKLKTKSVAVKDKKEKEKDKPKAEPEPIEELTPEEREAQIKINRLELLKNTKPDKKKNAAQSFAVEVKEPLAEQTEEHKESGLEEEVDFEDDSKLPDPWDENIDYEIPVIDDILTKTVEEDIEINDQELKLNARQLQDKLKLFDIAIENIEVFPGPVVTMYEITPAPGVKISKIVSLENDIAMALAARGIRIIAPIPGKSAIGVEIPNAKPQVVSAYSIMNYVESVRDASGKVSINGTRAELPLGLGKTIVGDVFLADLAKIPHLLVAGSTGSGKSVGINMIITSLLFTKKPSELKFAIIDPKKIELSFYQKLRYHYLAVCPDLKQDIVTDPNNAKILLKSLEIEMDQRYDMLANAGVKGIVEYNAKVAHPDNRLKNSKDIKHHFLPYIVVVIDELADLMMTSGREVEEPIARIAQLARAVGIHLIVATQRPSVDVITGMIKANFNARIAYQVATKVDSRTILDMNGAEQLLGRGDMLYLPPGTPKPIRLQNAFISVDEVEKLTHIIGKKNGYSKPYFLPSLRDKKQGEAKSLGDNLDPLFEDAARVIVQNQQGSVSLLQRRLKLGYARAARIVDQLEEYDIVGPNDGSKAREVKVKSEEELETKLRTIL